MRVGVLYKMGEVGGGWYFRLYILKHNKRITSVMNNIDELEDGTWYWFVVLI